MRRVALLLVVVGCGGGQSPAPAPPCTPAGQEVDGTPLVFEVVDLGFQGGLSPAPTKLIASDAELAAEFGGTPPMELDDVDLATDRIVLGASNPVLRFVVDDAGELVVGEEPLCQGVPPSMVAYVLRDNTSDGLAVIGCPYTGPDPCLAP